MENKEESVGELVTKRGDATGVPFVLSKTFQIFFKKGLTNIQCCVIIYSTKEQSPKEETKHEKV